MKRKLIILHIIRFFGFIGPFICIIFYLYRNFGIIGLKDKYFINSENIPYINKIKRKKNELIELPKILEINENYKKILKRWWFKRNKKPLNLDKPLTFNEKIQWLKLYDSTPHKTLLADKYKVRDYITKKIGKEYLIPLYNVYNKFEEINFEKLPKQFVIKCNHGSGYNIIIKDKSNLNLTTIKKNLDKWMNSNFAFYYGLELHYRDIEPKIIIEKYLDDGTGDLRDYKITCFNGKPEFIWIDSNRHTEHKRNLYDLNWNQLPYKINSHYETFPSPKKPKQLKKLLKLASILSKGFLYARVDFYIIKNKIYFGEITFTSSSGTEDILPHSFDKRLCSLIKLPKLAYNIDIGEYYILKNPLKTKFNLLLPNYFIIILLFFKLFYTIY